MLEGPGGAGGVTSPGRRDSRSAVERRQSRRRNALDQGWTERRVQYVVAQTLVDMLESTPEPAMSMKEMLARFPPARNIAGFAMYLLHGYGAIDGQEGVIRIGDIDKLRACVPNDVEQRIVETGE